jgi:hypothetical protein
MKSAVEWLEELIECGADIGQIKLVITKAKEMEQAQNERSRVIGYSQGYEHAMNMVGIDVNEH